MLQPWSAHHSLECRGFPWEWSERGIIPVIPFLAESRRDGDALLHPWLFPGNQGRSTGLLPLGSQIPGMLLQQLQQPPELPFCIPVRVTSFSRREMKLFSPRICPCGSGHGAAPGTPPRQRHGRKKCRKTFEAKLGKKFCHKMRCPVGARSKGWIPFGFPLLNPTFVDSHSRAGAGPAGTWIPKC